MSKKDFSEFFDNSSKCMICYETISKSTMCPQCHKVFCEECLKKCINENKSCPNCRAKIQVKDVIKINLVDELIKFKNLFEKNPREMCKLHNKKKKYLCFTCMKLFCSNCLILGKHDQSHFLLDKKSQGNDEDFSSLLLVSQPLIHFSDFLSEDYISQIKEKIETLEKSKTKQITYLKNYTAALTKLFDDTIEALNKQIENYSSFSEQFQKETSGFKTSINDLLSIGAPPAKVKDIHFDVLKFLEKKQKDIVPLYACISPKPLGFAYNKISFTIVNLRDIIKNKYPEKEDIYSPTYPIDFLSFSFLINPYGYGETAKNKYMSVFIGLKEGNKGEIYNFDYKFEMVNFKGEKNFEKSFVSSNFESGGTSWGCFQFYKLDELDSKGFIDEEGNVVLNCYIKPSTEEDIRKAFEYYYVNKMKMALPY